MNDDTMDKVIDDRLNQSREILLHKAKEYVRNGDRLHNFNVGARMSGQSRERVLKGFMLKHFISVFDIIDDIDKGVLPKEDVLNEKIGDSINYLILLEASIKDKLGRQANG